MCTTKKLLFSTRSYRLRKWLESQYKATMYKAATTNSYYYYVNLDNGQFKIRISDHFPDSFSNKADYFITISYDPHDINKNVYIISTAEYPKNIYAITNYSDLKFDINRTIVNKQFIGAKLVATQKAVVISATKVVEEEAEKKQETKKEDAVSLIVNRICDDADRTTNPNKWGTVCLSVPYWIKMDKPSKKAVKDLLSTKISFADATAFIQKNYISLSRPKFIVEIYKKVNELKYNKPW